ncbi:MAG: invasion associated locus B family protein [Pseudomonadota bacterium]
MTLARPFAFGLFCALALSGGALMAQDAAPAEPSDLPLGEPEPAAPGIYVAEVFGDWEKRCARLQDGTDPCQLFQILRDSTGNPVAEFTIAPLPTPEGGAVAGGTIITPLDTLLTGQLRLGVDGGETKVYPFRFCREIGCYVRLGFTAEDIAAFKRGNAAQVAIVPLQAPDQLVTLTTSLSGFTAGYDSLAAEN